jgi:class 3 adenylate cyclase
MESKDITIMGMDIREISRKASAITNEEKLLQMEYKEEMLKHPLAKFGGKIVKTVGELFIVSFDNADNSIRCSNDIFAKIIEYNRRVADADKKMEAKISIDSGEVILSKNDILGSPIDTVVRLSAITPYGRIFFSESALMKFTRDFVKSEYIAAKELKTGSAPLKIYRLLMEEEPQPVKPQASAPATRGSSGFELQDEEKQNIKRLEHNELGSFFDFTNIDIEKKMENASISSPEPSTASSSIETLELATPPDDFEQLQSLKTEPSIVRTDAGIEHSKEILASIREEKSKGRKIITMMIAGIVLITALISGIYFYLGKESQRKKDEELKKAIEQSAVLDALRKTPTPSPTLESTIKPIQTIEWARINIRTTPRGASVILNGKRLKGWTPLKLKKMEPDKTYRITLKKQGYKPYDLFFDLLPDEDKEIDVILTR